MDRVRPDYSARLNLTGMEDKYPEGVLVNPRYDRVDMYRWISHSILRVVLEEGVAHIHVSEATGDLVHERTGIPLVELEWITDTDYENYLEIQSRPENLEDLFDDDPFGDCEL